MNLLNARPNVWKQNGHITYGPLEVTQRRADCSIRYVGTCSWDRQTIAPIGFYDGYQNQKRTASGTQRLFV